MFYFNNWLWHHPRMKKILYLLLTLPSLGFSSNTILETSNLNLGEVLNHSYFFQEANKEQSYSLYIPSYYDSSKTYPLIILLHGLGSNPNQIINYQGIITEAENRGYILAAPYGYNERGWYGSRGEGKNGIGFGKDDDPENLGELSEKDVLNVLKIMKKNFSVNPNQIYIVGHSMGGAGALHLASSYSDEWAGIACLAPAFHSYTGDYSSLNNLKDIPIYVAIGDKDRLVPVRTVRSWVKEMEQLNMNIKYNEIRRGRHFRAIARNPEMISDVFDFFEEQG
jgi:predicted peptidase